jgi:nucleoside-diphosphate-sugar epimerase
MILESEMATRKICGARDFRDAQSIEIYEDGRMQRDFVPIQEVVKANAKVLELDVSGVLNNSVYHKGKLRGKT